MQRVGNLVLRLADACERAFTGIAAGLNDAVEFTPGHDVEARALSRQQAQHSQVGIGLNGVADLMIQLAESAIQTLEMIRDGVAAVDVKGGAVRFGKVLQRDRFARELV